ncbi:hypothetical protein NKK48_30325 [Mesorhizobium sp. C386A]|uniref:hypothetical protein n=1 Tax=Mesorhizobium sp. C386A TaxID=2956831 RepID=UPI00333BD3BA
MSSIVPTARARTANDPEWTPGQQTDAQAEGWDIFEASGSELNKDGDRPFQLQACDEADIFKGYTRDTDAWQHVYDQAHAGSQLHQQALNFLRAGSLPSSRPSSMSAALTAAN